MATAILSDEGKQLTAYSHVPLFADKFGELQQRYPNRLVGEAANSMAAVRQAGNVLPEFKGVESQDVETVIDEKEEQAWTFRVPL